MNTWNHPHLQALSAAGALRAWMGGSKPAPLSTIGAEERRTVDALFREQVRDWRAGWNGDAPDKELLRLFWNRARYDAHATHRDFMPCQFGAL